VPSQRREVRAERTVTAERTRKRSQSTFGAYGERPPSPFGGLPIAEVAIFAGLVALVLWLINGGTAELVVGSLVCALGVLEVTTREHFSGYRSHTILLAAVPAVALEAGLFAAGVRPRERALLLVAVIPVFALGFWWLRKRFIVARQRRIARPPAS
jgi:prepilin signal peptidase PulO-like enzyme (type II secretory pathway)